MRSSWLIALLIVLLVSGNAQADRLRIGLLSPASPFVKQNTPPGILDDEISILFSNTLQPAVQRFSHPDTALSALQHRQIDLLIASRAPAQHLVASTPLLTFPLASLTLKHGQGGTICFPELPPEIHHQCSSTGSPEPGENVRRLAQGDASSVIAPEFILRTWLAHAPATTLKLAPMEGAPALHFYAWSLPERTDILEHLNALIHQLNPEDARWLEKKWLLPDGSVFNARQSPIHENAPRMALHIILPEISPPLVQLTANGKVYGVWHDLLLSLFPENRYALTFGLDNSQPPAFTRGRQASLRIVASATSPSKEAVAFDSLNWALVSPDSRLFGTIPALRDKRIAVMRHSPVIALLRHRLPPANLVQVNDLAQGIELLRAGGADAVAGDAFALNFILRQHRETSLSLTPLALPDIPLWLVPDIPNPADASQVKSVLESVNQADIYNHLSRALSALNAPPDSQARSLWLIVLGVVSICAALIALVAFSAAQLQRSQRERDTTALHNALALWQTLMNNAPVPLFVCEPSGRLTRYNETFIRSPLLSEPPEEGTLFSRLPLGELSRQLALPQRLSLLNASAPLTGETTLNNGGATLYWWLCRYTDNRGQPQGIVGGWVDISEKAALTAALNQALARAERASFEKSNFLARMSHDIRTPLNAVLGLLEMERGKSTSLNTAWQAASSLRDLIGDILDLSRIEAGELQLTPAPYPLWQVLNASAEIFASTARAKGLHWRCELDLAQDDWFCFDKTRLSQIVANLLGNAIKYTSQGEVAFQASIRKQHLWLVIQDTGIGISADAIPSLGQPWFQADSTVSHSSGLGLAICYQLLELMGGTLEITSAPASGTQVTVNVPLQPVPPGEMNNEETTIGLPSARRIMIVDDFPANLTVLTLQLQKLGQQVIACASASEALTQLESETVDVLITDCQMSTMDGYQLTTLLLLRDIAGIRAAPNAILGCTANALQEEEDRARHAGMDELLRKPLTTGDLYQALSRHDGRRNDIPDPAELQRLADGRVEVMMVMRQQIHDAITHDLQQLREEEPSPERLSQIAHRLKASWMLFNMRETARRCQALEALPELVSADLIDNAWLPPMTNRFCTLMQTSLTHLDSTLAELSDKY
jgi:two-component system sensor histidine kinase EvgS